MVLYTIASTTARLILRIVFSVLFLYLGVIGSHAYNLSIRLRLVKHDSIGVSEASGWLQSAAVVTPIYTLRRLPPNLKWWGLMAAIAIFAKSTDLATSYVRRDAVQSFCAFGTGMVLNTSGADAFGIPPWNGRPALVAGNAQITSALNNCTQGIYSKVNNDPRFCAAGSDILGAWACEAVGQDLTYEYGSWTADAIADDLANQGLLYGPDFSPMMTTTDNEYDFTHFVVWSSSTSERTVFDVRAAVDTTGSVTDSHIMHSMHCIMNASGVPPARISQSFLTER